LLILGTSGALLLALAIGGFVWWLIANRAELRQKGIAAQAEGKQYGVDKSSHACVDESLTRLDRTGGIIQQTMLGMFLKGCLRSAPRDPALCVGVPATSEMLQSAIWRTDTCAAHGKPGDEACARLFGMIQEVCHPPSLDGHAGGDANFVTVPIGDASLLKPASQ
jgi:hypothetical protein